MGAAPLNPLSPEGYTPEVTSRVYDTLVTQARTALRAGHAVVADAVFGRPEQRQAIEDAARMAGVPFTGVWLEAPEHVMVDRIRTRTGDASDATPDVLAGQLARDAGPLSWSRIDSTDRVGRLCDAIARQLAG